MKTKLPNLPGKTKKERDMMKTFMGCDIGEWRVGYLHSSEYYQTALILMDRGWLKRKIDHEASGKRLYYIFALTALGKHQLIPRERAYANRF